MLKMKHYGVLLISLKEFVSFFYGGVCGVFTQTFKKNKHLVKEYLINLMFICTSYQTNAGWFLVIKNPQDHGP